MCELLVSVSVQPVYTSDYVLPGSYVTIVELIAAAVL